MKKTILLTATAVLLSTPVFAKEVAQCAVFGKPSKARPVNDVALNMATKLKVSTCESAKFVQVGAQLYDYQEVEATEELIKKHDEFFGKILMQKVLGKKSTGKLW